MKYPRPRQIAPRQSDEEWTRAEYQRRFGRAIDLDEPRSFNEKIHFYKLRYHKSLLTTLQDKYAVRSHVAGIIGEQHLVPLVGCYAGFDQIPIDRLPHRFIIKATHGSAWNVICMDKDSFDWDSARSRLQGWLRQDFYSLYREWAYKHIPPRIIVEHLLEEQDGSIAADYKVFCFNGEPRLIQVDIGRFSKHTRAMFDTDWNKLPFSILFPQHTARIDPPKPLAEMIEAARKLSRGLPFVRVDLYAPAKAWYFGEFCVYPAAGFTVFDPPEWDEILGSWFDISGIREAASEPEEPPAGEYDLRNLVRTTAARFGMPLFTTPKVRWTFTDKVFEQGTALQVRQMAPALGAFLDVGAHHGFYDLLVGGRNANCRIFAFEPVPENAAILRKNLELNRVAATVIQAAVSDGPATLPFQVSERTGRSGLTANPDTPVLKTIEVDVVKLDSYLGQLPAGPTLVKVDTEGNEIRVLEGMRDLIASGADLRLVMEVNPPCLEANGGSPQMLLDHLHKLGFDVFFMDDENIRHVRYQPGTPWEPYFGESYNRNIYCLGKTRSLSVLFFSHSSQLGGSERTLLELVAELIRDYGALCTVCLPGPGPLAGRLQDLGAATIVGEYDWWCSAEALAADVLDEMYDRSFEWTLRKLPDFRSLDPDLVLSNSLTIPWGAITAHMLDKPHVWRISEFGELDYGLKFRTPLPEVARLIAASSNVVATVSDAVRRQLFAASGVDHVQPIYSHVDVSESRISAPTDYFRDSHATRLILPGTIIASKGQEDAIRAVIELLKQRGRVLELLVVGRSDPAYLRHLQQLVSDAQVQHAVSFLDFQEDIYPIIQQADIVLVCSRSEAFGRVAVEAMSMKKPVIGTKAGGATEAIRHGVTGLLYAPGDHVQLADQIERLMDQPALRQDLTQEAFRLVSNEFTEANFGGRFYKLMLDLKSARNKQGAPLRDLMNVWFLDQWQAKSQALESLQAESLQKEQLRQELEVLKAEKEHLKQELEALRAGLVAQLVHGYRLLVDRILPPGTGGRRLYLQAIGIVRKILNLRPG